MSKIIDAITGVFSHDDKYNRDQWTLDKDHTRIGFSISHMGFSVSHGIFTDYESELLYNSEAPEESELKVKIKVDSLSTLAKALDKHLLSEDFFHESKYPYIEFESTDVDAKSESELAIKGDLTILESTHSVTLDVTINKDDISPMTEARVIGFSATTTINRSDFGMENLLPAVGDKVRIDIDGELIAAHPHLNPVTHQDEEEKESLKEEAKEKKEELEAKGESLKEEGEEKYEALKEKSKEALTHAKEESKEALEKGKERSKAILKEGKEKSHDFLEEAKSFAEKAKDKTADKLEDAGEATKKGYEEGKEKAKGLFGKIKEKTEDAVDSIKHKFD